MANSTDLPCARTNPCEQRGVPTVPTHLDSASREKFLFAPLTQIFAGEKTFSIYKYRMVWEKIFVALGFSPPSTVMSF